MRLLALSSCALLLLGNVACSSADGGSSHTGTQDSEIINGNLDTTHQAVVTILSQDSACSGTIVAKDVTRGIGYVLTAAHCVDSQHPPVEVHQGNDYAQPDKVYSVLSYQQHPAYGGVNTQNDVGMIRIAGVDAATPTVDIGFGASVSNGMSVMSVGYGLTGDGSQNSRRYNITKNLNGVSSAIVQYSLSGGGICSGDSGGPVLSPTSGSQQVIAVHSSVSNSNGVTCSGTGYSVRVSYHQSFITDFINEQVEQSCDVCRQVAQSGTCSSAIDSCLNNSSCSALVQCFNACASGDSACIQTCANNNSGGVSLYNAIIDCTCNACTTECEAECAGPSCGFQFQDATCTSCHEASCCQEGIDCADDAECTTCVTTSNPPASCANNAALNAWNSCLSQSCASECNVSNGGSGGSGGSSGSAGSAGSAGSSSGGNGGSGGSGAEGGAAGSGVGGDAGSGAGGSGASAGNSATGGSRNDGGSSSSATCTLSVANSGHGSGAVGGLMLLGLLGLGLRRRRH